MVVGPTLWSEREEIGDQLDLIDATREDGGRGHVERKVACAGVQGPDGEIERTLGGGHQNRQRRTVVEDPVAVDRIGQVPEEAGAVADVDQVDEISGKISISCPYLTMWGCPSSKSSYNLN